MNPRCDGCRYFRLENTVEGTCRRHPPVLIAGYVGGTKAGGVESMFPAVRRDVWCGEFASVEGDNQP